MTIHFVSSRQNFETEYEYLSKIAKIIKDSGHTFAREWLEEEYKFVKSGRERSEEDWRKINQDNIAALSRADIVIVEASARSFSMGYQVATAIQQKKPTLILTRNDSLVGTFGSGIVSDLVRIVNVTHEDLVTTINSFIKDNTIETKDMRFNFFINRQIYNYLRWASFKTGKTKAEVLRELVEREIRKDI